MNEVVAINGETLVMFAMARFLSKMDYSVDTISNGLSRHGHVNYQNYQGTVMQTVRIIKARSCKLTFRTIKARSCKLSELSRHGHANC